MNELGGANKRQLKMLEKWAAQIESLADKYAAFSDGQLKEQTALFRERLNGGESLNDLLPEAYAVCREASTRVLHQRHFHVQLLGGIALHQGRICQMATGEGKTLTETLPVYLNALEGKGVHVVTVNSYLAKRDAEWMGKIYKFLGLTVGVTYSNQRREEKKASYDCDVTYGTNNEFGFDYLRDNMAHTAEGRVQRPLNFAIIDEVDSILIDEARTPLIISGRSDKSSQMYLTANRFAKTLVKDADYEIDEKVKEATLLDSGIEKAEKYFNVSNLGDIENTELNHYINSALKAHVIMKRDNNYIVENGKVVIVDEFTGRKMEGRRYSGGLHQAIEAKENVPVKEESRTLATISFQNYFRLYKKLSGMTGTAKTEEEEFNDIYKLDVVVIPTNLPNARADLNDKIYKTRQGKLRNIVEEVKERNEKGQPILIGTVTVEKSEELSAMLSKRGVKHDVLNAKNHAREAEIVAQAGRLGAVTIATNMAGRGTDILLGGNPEFLAKREMGRLGFNEEQVEIASSYAAGDEEAQKLKQTYQELLQKYGIETEKEKQKVIEAGGLHILGTERHDSRRIDNQLRGRSGRQGDIGSSVFYLSCEDDMMRVFAGEKIQQIMGFLKVDEDMPIEAKMITGQIEGSQKRIEGLHFSSRKRLLSYDDVNNVQRATIYGERNKVLDNADIHGEIVKMCSTYARKALEDACGGSEKVKAWDLDKVNGTLSSKYYPLAEELVTEEMQMAYSAREVHKALTEKTVSMLEERGEALKEEEIDFCDLEKYILLKIIDEKWIDHLDALDQLKQGVGLQSVGHHDPVSVYKEEGFKMFEELMDSIQFTTVKYLLFAHVAKQVRPKEALQRAKKDLGGSEQKQPNFNDPCPCGSGEKFKNCCGKELAAKAKEEWRQSKKGKKS